MRLKNVKDIISIASRISISIRKSQIRCRAKRFGPECKLSRPILVPNFQRYIIGVKIARCFAWSSTDWNKWIYINWPIECGRFKKSTKSSVQLHQTFAICADTHGRRARGNLAWFQQRWLQIDFDFVANAKAAMLWTTHASPAVVLRRQ